MMLLPLGDDVNKRGIPLVGMFLIAANLLVSAYEFRLYLNDQKKEVWDKALDETTDRIVGPGTSEFVDEMRALEEYEDPETTKPGPQVIEFDPESGPEIDDEALGSDLTSETSDQDGEFSAFIHDWGLVPADFAKGRFIGCFTHMFLHGDLDHFLGNMLMLWIFVSSLEELLGSLRFLVLYITWGLVAGLTQCFMNWGEDIPLIGASGAISGVAGAYLVAFGALSRIRVWWCFWFFTFHAGTVRVPAGVFICLWIIVPNLLGIAEAQETGLSNVAWFAHVGGFAAGVLYLLPYFKKVRRRMSVNVEGEAEIETGDAKALAAAVAELGSIRPNDPTQCDFCGTELKPENRMYENMFRCPNPSCQRIVWPQLRPENARAAAIQSMLTAHQT